jgi:beta-lactamase family protein
VPRFAAALLLAVCALAGARAVEAVAGGDRQSRAAVLPGPAAAEVYPALRSVSELGPEGGARRDAGVGVYPALSSPEALVFPPPRAVQAARAYAASRQGKIAFAVADARGGIAGQAFDQRFESASLVKAMLLVAYLDQLASERGELSLTERSRIDPMVRVSDNYSATEVFRRLAPGALANLAKRAGMRSFSVGSDWSSAQVTAADQARFFLAIDRLLPPPHRAYGLNLLADIVPFQSWGIPEASRPAWRTYFKGGWRPDGGGQLIHQAALLERGPRRLAIAVLTDRDPSEAYGRETIRGIAQRLLRPAPTPVAPARPRVLAPIESLRGYVAPAARPLRPLGA